LAIFITGFGVYIELLMTTWIAGWTFHFVLQS
jgi:hypothetical protein